MSGKIILLIGGSGSGKSSLIKRLRQEYERVRFIPSVTTRPKRPTEHDGESYHFVDVKTFQQLIQENGFIEYAHVHRAWYGTPRKAYEEILATDGIVIKDIDPKGATAFKTLFADHVITIFVSVPPDLMKERLLMRGDTPEFEARLVDYADAWKERDHYDYMIENIDFEQAYADLLSIISAYIPGQPSES
ncbi:MULTISPECIES: GTPase [Exiguobacterium]|uniref:guanylate kinase n=1 Tax=Exiguobacterium TaxID=33986 RepID=UPI001BE5B415|nr:MULTISPECIES: GTPase [Exiguobacterium]MCT4790981.1 50S ribosome-binding GTPase [Exiguobacterium artemiae]